MTCRWICCSADLPFDAFDRVPPEIARPSIDPAAAERIVQMLAEAQHPLIYAGGGVISARATSELATLAEALEVPVAHSLMGKGCLREDHPLLLGMTGFWGTPIANDTCRQADVMLAVGTRLAEASSSSWDPRFTFAAPPTRVIHIDADLAEIGRNLPTELGVVADAKLALAALAAAAQGRRHRDRGRLRELIAGGRRAFAEEWHHHWTSDQYPLRPERILNDLRQVVPEDGFIVTDVGWNKNGVAQQFSITVPGTFITPSGLATMGFGAVGGPRREDRAAAPRRSGARRRWRVRRKSERRRHRDGSRTERRLGDHGQRRVRNDRRPREDALRLVVRLRVRIERQAVPRRFRGDGARLGCAWRDGRVAGRAAARAREAIAANRPAVVQVPMENAPTPTPGHWNINDIYRKGE